MREGSGRRFMAWAAGLMGSGGRGTNERTGNERAAGRNEGNETVAAVMDPLPARLALHHSVAAARELMSAAGYSFLVVVAPTTGKLLGIVLRRSLERGCEPRGHDPETCPLVRHVTTDIDFCFEGEAISEVFGTSATAIETRPEEPRTQESRRRNALPVIVVDQNKVPVGLLSRRRAASL